MAAHKDIEARLVNNALVVSLLGEAQPRVWRADMSGLPSATFELREDGDKKRFSVVMTRRHGDEETVVSYGDRDSAAYALSALTDAMLDGYAGAAGAGSAFKYVIVTAIVLIGILFLLFSPSSSPSTTRGAGAGRITPMATNPNVKPGEPIPADKLFGN